MFNWYSFGLGVAAATAASIFMTLLASFVSVQRIRGTPIRGKNVVITGGSSGIGLAAARLVLKEGAASVTLVARRENVLREAQESLGDKRVRTVACDVTNTADVTRLLFPLSAGSGKGSPSDPPPCDILICSAGASLPSRALDQPLDEHRHLFNVNYFAVVNCVNAAARQLIQRDARGAIVIINSLSAAAPVPGLGAYAASKAAIRAYAEALTLEVAHFGINVTTVYPPDVDTPMFAAENLRKPEECKAICSDGGLFTADDIARDTVAAITTYRPHVFTGLDGNLAGLAMCAGPCATETSLPFLFTQGLILGIVRLVSVWYNRGWRGIVKKHYNRAAVLASIAAVGGEAAAGAVEQGKATGPLPQMGKV